MNNVFSHKTWIYESLHIGRKTNKIVNTIKLKCNILMYKMYKRIIAILYDHTAYGLHQNVLIYIFFYSDFTNTIHLIKRPR